MKRRLTEALIPFTFWLMEHWPRQERPSVLNLPDAPWWTRINSWLTKHLSGKPTRMRSRTALKKRIPSMYT